MGSSPIARTVKKSEFLLSENEARIKDIESQRYTSINLEEAAEAGFDNAYAWFEDMVITGRATVEMGKETGGNESATIKFIDPKTPRREFLVDVPRVRIELTTTSSSKNDVGLYHLYIKTLLKFFYWLGGSCFYILMLLSINGALYITKKS